MLGKDKSPKFLKKVLIFFRYFEDYFQWSEHPVGKQTFTTHVIVINVIFKTRIEKSVRE